MLDVLDDRVQVLAVSVEAAGLSSSGGMLTLAVCDADGRMFCCTPIKPRQPALKSHAGTASCPSAVLDMDDALDAVAGCIEHHTDVIIVTGYDIDRDLRLRGRLPGGLMLRTRCFQVNPLAARQSIAPLSFLRASGRYFQSTIASGSTARRCSASAWSSPMERGFRYLRCWGIRTNGTSAVITLLSPYRITCCIIK